MENLKTLTKKIWRHFRNLPRSYVNKGTSTKFATRLCCHLVSLHAKFQLCILNSFFLKCLRTRRPSKKPLNRPFFKPEVRYQKSGSIISIPEQYLPSLKILWKSVYAFGRNRVRNIKIMILTFLYIKSNRQARHWARGPISWYRSKELDKLNNFCSICLFKIFKIKKLWCKTFLKIRRHGGFNFRV